MPRPLFAVAALLAVCSVSCRPGYQKRVQAALRTVDAVVAQGPYQASWDSLTRYKVPNWYRDAKFGIFIHWGVYSVPAFRNEWYPRNMYIQGSPEFKHHVATFGPQSTFGYKDFIPKFTAEKFDAGHWADVFQKAGAKFVVPVAEHHDGFPMYDCSFTKWSAARMGPKRDVAGLLAAAVRARGMVFGASSHRAEHWWFFDGGMKFDSDVRSGKYADFYGPAHDQKTPDGKQSQPDEAYLNDWLARTTEIVDKYQPQLIWFDWWIEQPAFQPYLQKFAAFYYNRGSQWNKGVAINYKKESFPERAAVLDIERGKLDTLRPLFWQTDTSICKRSWGYIQNHDYKTPDSIVDDLVDITSKNGALLLNIAPRPDGTIPEPQEQILAEIGKWLAVNGEAIYGTRPWKIFGEGPTKVVGGSFKDTEGQPFTGQDIRFTQKGDTLYAIALAWPEKGRLVVKALGSGSPHTRQKVETVRLLGSGARLRFAQTASGLAIELPKGRPGDYAFTFKIEPVDPAPDTE